MTLFIKTLRWIGRIGSILVALFYLELFFSFVYAFIKGDNVIKSWKNIYSGFFFLAFAVGLILSWPREKSGIILSYISYAALFVLFYFVDSSKATFETLCFLIPTTILLICRLLSKYTSV